MCGHGELLTGLVLPFTPVLHDSFVLSLLRAVVLAVSLSNSRFLVTNFFLFRFDLGIQILRGSWQSWLH